MRIPILPIICTMFLRLWAQTTLSGNIGGMTLEHSGNPFLVTETITVQSGKTTTVKPGCIFLFKPFTGIDVRGTLVVAGVHDTPVVFTSINDINYNQTSEQGPNPFDWNGITVGSDAKNVRFSNFMLAYSVYGIKSMQEDVSIENGIFLQNGQFNFTINGAMQQVPDNLPYSYNLNGSSNNSIIKKSARPLKVVALSTGITGMATTAAATVFYSKAITANREGNSALSPADINTARDRETTALKRAGALYGTAAALVTTAMVMYVSDRRIARREKVTVVPYLNNNKAGVCVQYRF